MQALEDRFRDTVIAPRERKRAERGESELSQKQLDYLLSNIDFHYPGHEPLKVVQALMECTRQPRKGGGDFAEDSVHAAFVQFCRQRQFSGFTFLEIGTLVTEDGVRKKDPRGYPKWKYVTRDNFEAYVNPCHSGFAFVTGAKSGITVIDCDTVEAYEAIVRDHPCLRDTLTVRTRQGAHLYCQYDPTLRTSNASFEHYAKVDIRNDAGIIFAPPTRYDFFGDAIAYTFVCANAPVLPIPIELVNQVKSDYRLSSPVAIQVPQEIKSVDELSAADIRALLKLFKERPKIIKRYPVICNGVFELGYQSADENSSECYYVKFHEMLVMTISAAADTTLDQLLQRLRVYEGALTFDVYSTDDGGCFRVYCVSRPFYPFDPLVSKVQQALGCTLTQVQETSMNGWAVPFTGGKKDHQYMGRVGRCETMDDLVTLVQFKQHLTESVFTVPLSQESLQRRELFRFHFPSLKQFALFISFQTPPDPENCAED